MKTGFRWVLMLALPLLFTACKDEDKDSPTDMVLTFSPGQETELQQALIDAQAGTSIQLTAGTFTFTSSLSMLGKTDVEICGAGRGLTVLDFSNQVVGAEGLRIDGCSRITLCNFTVQEAKGDGVKAKDCDALVMRGLGAVWLGDPDSLNGSYGLYPVECTNVLMEDCYARGASDAGIYVGQSEYVIVRACTAEYNVAGIEIENTSWADVYNCRATQNTGGLLVFDLPTLVKKNGGSVRLFDNLIDNNSTANFAPVNNIVGQVPPGTGVMILATQKVEVTNNQISGNNAIGVAILSYVTLTLLDPEFVYDDSLYNPFTAAVYVRNNIFSSSAWVPDVSRPVGEFLFDTYGTDTPDILYDGLLDPEKQSDPNFRICLQGNVGSPSYSNYLNSSQTLTDMDCSLPLLSPVTLDLD